LENKFNVDICLCRLILEKFGVTAFAMEDVERYGIHEVTQRALEAINPNGDRSLHVSFDIDSLDPLEAPSTGTTGELDFLLPHIYFRHTIPIIEGYEVHNSIQVIMCRMQIIFF
jgi:hypothetical protein